MNVVFGSTADSDIGRFRLSEDSRFSHWPSFSTRRGFTGDAIGAGFTSSPELVRIGIGIRWVRVVGGLGVLRLSSEDILVLTEWPLMVDTELSVSEEIVDRGRGMNSTLSEKPTRGLDCGLAGGVSRGGPKGSAMPLVDDRELSSPTGGPGYSNGELGKLLLRRGWVSLGGCMSFTMSWLEMAAERRWACPRRVGAVTVAGTLKSDMGLIFVGLELKALENPSRESPPTNSLPPLLWPVREGVAAIGSSGVRGGVWLSRRPEMSTALKVKFGRPDAALV